MLPNHKGSARFLIPVMVVIETVSNTTITGIKNLGVPTGTKWASKLLYW